MENSIFFFEGFPYSNLVFVLFYFLWILTDQTHKKVMNPFFERLSKIPTIVYMANRYGLSHNEVAGIASASLVDNGVVTNTDTTKLISPKKVAWQRETIANAELEKRNLAAKEVDCLLFDGKIIDCLVRKSGEGSPTKNGKLDVYAIVDGSTSQYLTHIEKKRKREKTEKRS